MSYTTNEVKCKGAKQRTEAIVYFIDNKCGLTLGIVVLDVIVLVVGGRGAVATAVAGHLHAVHDNDAGFARCMEVILVLPDGCTQRFRKRANQSVV